MAQKIIQIQMRHLYILILKTYFQIANRAVASLTVPGGGKSSTLLIFPQISINFSSNFTYFLPHFGPPGGRVHPGRPWLRH